MNDIARQGFVDVLPQHKCKNLPIRTESDINKTICYGCMDAWMHLLRMHSSKGTGDSVAPVTCALKGGKNPIKNGIVVAVHSHGCGDLKKQCTPDAPSVVMKVTEYRDWVRGTMAKAKRKMRRDKMNKVILETKQKMRKFKRHGKSSIELYVIVAAALLAVYFM